MDSFWLAIESSWIAAEIGATWWFPLIESVHVLSITFMLGAIVMLDLRLLSWAALAYSIERMSKELVPWSAMAFVVASVTGVGMFITRASAHVDNPALQIKLLLLAAAGCNIAYCHSKVLPTLASVDDKQPVSLKARMCAALSLSLWCGVMLAGRWIGHII